MFTTLAATLVALAAAFTPCATEDSVNCTWDAPTQGNGVGQSFTIVEWPAGSESYYITTHN